MKINDLLSEFEEVIGYKYNDIRLLRQALTHSSFANEKRLDMMSTNVPPTDSRTGPSS